MKKILSTLLAIGFLFSLTACSNAEDPAHQPVYGIVMSSDNAFQNSILEGFQAAVGSLDALYLVEETDGTVEDQLRALDTLEKQGVDGIILHPAAASGTLDTDALALVSKYSDLEVICVTNGTALPTYCEALAAAGSSVTVTGICRPSLMKNLVGSEKNCPYFYLWNPTEIGQHAAYILAAMQDGLIGEPGTSFKAENGVTYQVSTQMLSEKTVLADTILRFDQTNIGEWSEIY